MALRVSVYSFPGSNRSTGIARAMAQGIHASGDAVQCFRMTDYAEPNADVAVFYGLMRPILDGYRKAGKAAIYIDLGYWGRHEGGRRDGYHKFALNSRHPTAYFQNKVHCPKRFQHFHQPVYAWRSLESDGNILLAGMSAKAARAEGFAPEEWERSIVKEIRKHTDRPILYRPKPNWPDATHIQGTKMVKGEDGDAHRFIRSLHAVVTHHSNMAVEAILAGVPVFCWDGVATAPGKGCSDISKIESPPDAINREQWAADIAWTQWNLAEMTSGRAWKYLKDEVLG